MNCQEFEGLIAQRQARYTLPAPFYLDHEITDEDVPRIFGLAGLILICLAQEPPEDFALMRSATRSTISR